MTERVLAVFQEARGLYGSPRVMRQLGLRGIPVGRRRVARLMRLAQIQGRSARHPLISRSRSPAGRRYSLSVSPFNLQPTCSGLVESFTPSRARRR